MGEVRILYSNYIQVSDFKFYFLEVDIYELQKKF